MIRNWEEQGCCVVLISKVLVIKPLAWLLCIEPRAGDGQTVVGRAQFHTAPLTGLRACAGQFYLLIIGIPLTQAKRRDPLDSLSWDLLMPLRVGQTLRPVSFPWNVASVASHTFHGAKTRVNVKMSRLPGLGHMPDQVDLEIETPIGLTWASHLWLGRKLRTWLILF